MPPDYVSPYIMVILLIECTDAFCRVPYIVLSHRLSILYPRTCVGLGYGDIRKQMFSLHYFPDPNWIFCNKFINVWLFRHKS